MGSMYIFLNKQAQTHVSVLTETNRCVKVLVYGCILEKTNMEWQQKSMQKLQLTFSTYAIKEDEEEEEEG